MKYQVDALEELGRLKRQGGSPNLTEVAVYFEEDGNVHIEKAVTRVRRSFKGTGVELVGTPVKVWEQNENGIIGK